MPDTLARPLTPAEMCRRCAEMLETGNDRDRVLMAVRHTLQEVQEELYRRHPGSDIDEMLGTGAIR